MSEDEHDRWPMTGTAVITNVWTEQYSGQNTLKSVTKLTISHNKPRFSTVF